MTELVPDFWEPALPSVHPDDIYEDEDDEE